jgi:fatty acid desaturase
VNSGDHTAHHLQPAVPWFRWPELHREIEARIPAALGDAPPASVIPVETGP